MEWLPISFRVESNFIKYPTRYSEICFPFLNTLHKHKLICDSLLFVPFAHSAPAILCSSWPRPRHAPPLVKTLQWLLLLPGTLSLQISANEMSSSTQLKYPWLYSFKLHLTPQHWHSQVSLSCSNCCYSIAVVAV